MTNNCDFGIIPELDTTRNYGVLRKSYAETLIDHHCIPVEFEATSEMVKRILQTYGKGEYYWCQYGRAGYCIDTCGVTLIPPKSMANLIAAAQSMIDTGWESPEIIDQKNAADELRALCRLLEKAMAENKYAICYGL